MFFESGKALVSFGYRFLFVFLNGKAWVLDNLEAGWIFFYASGFKLELCRAGLW